MVSFIAVTFIVVCIFLVLLILIQDPKGGGGGLFGGGGGSNSILSSSGASDLLTQMTKYTAIAFGTLCIVLTIVTKPSKTGVFDKADVRATLDQQAAPSETEAPMANEDMEIMEEEEQKN